MKNCFNAGKVLCSVLVLGCMWLAGCGGEAEERVAAGDAVSGEAKTGGVQEGISENREKIRDLQSSQENIFSYSDGYPVGLQFYQGDVVQFRLLDKTQYTLVDGQIEAESDYVADIYLDRADGSSGLLAGDLSAEDVGNEWYLAQDGSFYCIRQEYENNTSSVIKRDAQGEVQYETQVDMRVIDICQLADGSVIVLLDDGGGVNSMLRLGELNQETGAVTELSQIQMYEMDEAIGAGAEGLLVLNRSTGIREVNIKDGSQTDRIEFANTSYKLVDYGWIKDIRVLEDGSAEFLWAESGRSTREKLEWEQIDKIPVVMRGFHFNNSWIKDAVAGFNRQSDAYVISLEEAGDDWDDFATQTSVQIASGGGPDLLYGEVLSDYIQGMLDKGGFEDLAPYMESSGIKEEDYFPLAFSSWRRDEKIYGINVDVVTYCYSMERSVLGGDSGEPDIETLVDALYGHDDRAMYMRFSGAGDILELFLEGSEDLWGMIDWEEGRCDFGGELFAKMMEVAKRYAYDENLEYPILASFDTCDSLLAFQPPSMLEEMGRVNVGVMFDDGCYPVVNSTYQILSVNANSRQKQGAWEFIAWLLGEEGQQVLMRNDGVPVSRKAFREKIDEDREVLENGHPVWVGSSYLVRGKYVDEMREIKEEDITEEWIEAFIKAAEDARPLPVRTKPVLEVIREEAEDYFNGMKSLEEVISIMENRVQLYLNENG